MPPPLMPLRQLRLRFAMDISRITLPLPDDTLSLIAATEATATPLYYDIDAALFRQRQLPDFAAAIVTPRFRWLIFAPLRADAFTRRC